jgi:hypothetical protein
MKRPVSTTLGLLTLALAAGSALVFFNAYRKGITIRLGESDRPILPPPPPTASALPDEQAPHYSNEQMHAMLQDETSQLGIRRFAERGESEEEPGQSFLGPRLGAPGSRAMAEAAIREIARLRHNVDAGKKKPVPLAGQTVPVLAEPESGGAAVEAAAAKGPPSPSPEGGLSPLPEETPRVKTLAPGSWSGLYGGDEEGTLTVSDAQAWASLWGRLTRQPAPELDFSRRQVVGVFLGPQSSGGFSVEISPKLDVLPTAVVVRYRVRSPGADRTPPEGATAPFALLAIDRTSLPVRFERQ